MKFIYFFITLFLLASTSLKAAEKHPRVAELEDKYKSSIIQFLEGRFPGVPFSIIVSVDPIRRSFSQNYDLKGEKLPFYALDDEHIQDEWDDPTASLYSLSQRVKKVSLTLHVPDTLNADEVAEIETTLVNSLKLIPARDEIKILPRQWNLFPKLKFYAMIVGAFLIAFLLGLMLIASLTTRKMASSIENIKSKSSSSSAPMNSPTPVQTQKSNSNSGGNSGDVRFNDPIRVREVISHKIENLVQRGELIRLDNFLKINQLGEKSPEVLGSLLIQFPVEIQKELFSLSRDVLWMEAFTQPGEVTFSTLSVIEDLSRAKPTRYRKYWELLLIQIWRLDKNAGLFLKSIDSKVAFAILSSMPKGISVPLAREVFPGNWAGVLNPDQQIDEISEDQCKNLYEQALSEKPLVDFNTLEIYKNERELLDYLDRADIRTEREIYEVSHDDSIIKKVRPPFYAIFDGHEATLKKLVEKVQIRDWSLALFNIDRQHRLIIEKYFNDKERYFFIENLKQQDKMGISMDDVAGMRSSIAKLFSTLSEELDDHPAEEESLEASTEADTGDGSNAA